MFNISFFLSLSPHTNAHINIKYTPEIYYALLTLCVDKLMMDILENHLRGKI